MKIQTKEWGALDVRDDQLIHFPEGLLGFEELRRFALLEIEECRPFLWMISTDEPEVSFVLAEPGYFQDGEYRVQLSASDHDRLELAEGDPVSIFVIVTVDAQRGGVAANLRGPVVLNTRNRLARQVITYGAGLALRQPLVGKDAPATVAEPAGSRI